MKLREQKKQRTRTEILETAIALFRQRGFEETRVRDITERVQISEATFFNYFPSKEAVLDAYSLDVVDLFGALLHHELSSPERPVAERIREIVGATAQSFAADPKLMAIVVTRSNLFFGSTGAKRERDLENYALMSELFREGQQRGEIRSDIDPTELSEILTGTFMLVILNWLLDWWGPGQDLESRLMRAVNVFLEGCHRP